MAIESDRQAAGAGDADDAAAPSKAPVAAETQTALVRLIRARLVERAPPCDLPPPRQEGHPLARKRKVSVRPSVEEEGEDARRRLEREAHAAYGAGAPFGFFGGIDGSRALHSLDSSVHRRVVFCQLSSATLNIPNVSPLLAARFRVPEDIAAAVTAGAEKALPEPPAGGNRKRTPGTCD